MVTILATNVITYSNALFITSIFSKITQLYICEDNTSWSTEHYSEVGGGLTGLITNNTGVEKVCQTFLFSDVRRISMCAYKHIHKFHVKHPGWTVWVNI